LDLLRPPSQVGLPAHHMASESIARTMVSGFGRITVDHFSNARSPAEISRLEMSVSDPDEKARLCRAGVVLHPVGQIRDLSQVRKTRWEFHFQLELHLGVEIRRDRAGTFIETTNTSLTPVEPG
ncbi:MAG: hypothetical protein AAFX94_13075, partial [Myxococcota bacterium]